jgi:thioredoxin-like negative regulator of GroEL
MLPRKTWPIPDAPARREHPIRACRPIRVRWIPATPQFLMAQVPEAVQVLASRPLDRTSVPMREAAATTGRTIATAMTAAGMTVIATTAIVAVIATASASTTTDATIATVTATVTAMTAATTAGETAIATSATIAAAPSDVSRLAAILALTGFALLGSARASAASAEALTLFAEATAAFEAGDFSRARALFDQALEAGLEGPAIHFNIGAAAFRAGDLPRAERAFREVARSPSMAALAHYNLGLVALDRRDEREAREWFERTLHQQNPSHDRLMSLAARRLEELPQARRTGAWSYYARGGAGYDDNIALRSDSVESSASGDEDSYAELTVSGNYAFGAWRLDAGAGMIEYTELDDFSQTSLHLGGARSFRLDDWSFELATHASQLSFGGEVFERNVTAGALATRWFYGGSRLRARLRAASVDGNGLFSGVAGDRTELGLYYDKAWRSWYFGAHTRAERNDSEDLIFASSWIQLGAEARYTLSPMWGFAMSAAVRRTTRPALSAATPERNDNRLALLASVTRTLWKHAQLLVRYEHESNDSPVAGYDYDRNRATASVEFWY